MIKLDIVSGEFFANYLCCSSIFKNIYIRCSLNFHTFMHEILKVAACKCTTKQVFLKIVQIHRKTPDTLNQ